MGGVVLADRWRSVLKQVGCVGEFWTLQTEHRKRKGDKDEFLQTRLEVFWNIWQPGLAGFWNGECFLIWNPKRPEEEKELYNGKRQKKEGKSKNNNFAKEPIEDRLKGWKDF